MAVAFEIEPGFDHNTSPYAIGAEQKAFRVGSHWHENIRSKIEERRKTHILTEYADKFERLIAERLPNGLDSPGLVINSAGANFGIVAAGSEPGQKIMFWRQIYRHEDDVAEQKISFTVIGPGAPQEVTASQIGALLHGVEEVIANHKPLVI